MIAVAIDEDVEKVRGFADDITYPVLVDAEHLLTELYAISNVPTVVMIDVDDTIVYPNWSAFGTDTFKDFTGIDSDTQMDRVRSWVRGDMAPVAVADARAAVGDLSADEEAAHLHFRNAAHLRLAGDPTGAERNFNRAAELAPHDWTIRRAMIPLRGGDPFGEEFLELYAEFDAAGRPYHGVTGY